MTPELKAQVIESVYRMLEDETVEIEFARGTESYAVDGWKRFEATKGRTLTIKVHGGAVHTER